MLCTSFPYFPFICYSYFLCLLLSWSQQKNWHLSLMNLNINNQIMSLMCTLRSCIEGMLLHIHTPPWVDASEVFAANDEQKREKYSDWKCSHYIMSRCSALRWKNQSDTFIALRPKIANDMRILNAISTIIIFIISLSIHKNWVYSQIPAKPASNIIKEKVSNEWVEKNTTSNDLAKLIHSREWVNYQFNWILQYRIQAQRKKFAPANRIAAKIVYNFEYSF